MNYLEAKNNVWPLPVPWFQSPKATASIGVPNGDNTTSVDTAKADMLLQGVKFVSTEEVLTSTRTHTLTMSSRRGVARVAPFWQQDLSVDCRYAQLKVVFVAEQCYEARPVHKIRFG